MKFPRRLVVLTMATMFAGHARAEDTQHWYRCNTHTHTASFPNSDANVSAEYAVDWYKKHGYQCLVITDHEHLTPVDQLNQEFGGGGQFLVIQGQEITQGIHDSSSHGGIRWSHVNGINTKKLILPMGYPNYQPTGFTLPQTYIRNVDEVYAAGGIPQINHPEAISGPSLKDLLAIQRPFLFEVWNAFPSIGALGGMADDGTVSPSFESLWDSLLSQGKTVWGVASDDVHDYLHFDDRLAPTPGRAWIVIQAPELSLDAVMDAVRSGHFYASTGVALKEYHADSKSIAMTIDPPFAWKSTTEKETVLYHTRFIGQGGRILAEMNGLSPHYQCKGDEGYVRASITDSDGRKAWTQPVFLDGRPAVMPGGNQ